MKTTYFPRLLVILLLAIVCSGAGAQGTFHIGTAQELVDFAALVNAGQNTANAVLTADIDMTGVDFTPIGNAEGVCYSGTFDGQGHTIDNLTFDTSNRQNAQGIFGYAGSATITDLIAGQNNRIYGAAFVAAFVGDKVGTGTLTIARCGNEGNVSGSAQNAAAFVGCVHNGNLVISHCYNTGRISGNRESAIFCGWFSGGSSSISDSYNSGTLAAGVEGSNALWRSSPAVSNVFDISGRQGTTRFSAAQRTSGYLCWKLNGSRPDGPFRQTLEGDEKDSWPTTSSRGHGVVYASGELKCDGSSVSGSPVFSNTDNATYLPHDFHDGLCSVCEQVDAEYMYADVEGYYQISTPAALRWVAKFINSNPANAALYLRLTDDIDMKNVNFDGIGTLTCPFVGEIDGGRHVISNLVMRRSGDTGVGLVNAGGGELEIHDLTLAGTCSFTGSRYVGGFVGCISGKAGDAAYFRNLGFEGSVTVTDNGGGIVGCVPNNDFMTFFTNCYVTGRVNGTKDNGALSGWSSYARLQNCYVKVSGKGWESGADVVRGFSPRFINCYAQGNVQKADGLHSFTLTEMQNGTLLRLLASDVFSQTIDEDAHPVIRPATQTGVTLPQVIAAPRQLPAHIYDLSGREVPPHKVGKGIYLVNGKKLAF